MEIEVTFSERQFNELARAFRTLPTLMAERVYGEGLLEAARVVRDGARGLVPVRTGALRQSIRARRQRAHIETFHGWRSVPGGAAQTYAVGRDAHLYLEPALYSTTAQQIQRSGEAMRRAFGARSHS